MIKALLVAAAVSVASLCTAVSAAPNLRGLQIGWKVHQPTRFIVSGVLRQDGTTDVIKPIHAIVTADNNSAAVASFARTVGQ